MKNDSKGRNYDPGAKLHPKKFFCGIALHVFAIRDGLTKFSSSREHRAGIFTCCGLQDNFIKNQ